VPTIKSFRLGDDFSFKQPIKPTQESFVSSGLKGGDFVLVVGTVEIRKNHILAYYTYKLAAHRGISLPKLVIIGRKGWMTEQAYELMSKDLEVKDMFVFIHDGSDENLSWAYENCLYTIYPSMYEGWGLPVAESAVRGVACITSAESSIPEVAGDLVEYVDPYSPDELLAKMASFNDSSVLRRARNKVKGYKTVTWDESYKQVAHYLSKDIIYSDE
jgi:glycosyltransferase involved in cell wall biosynthesis